MNIDEKLALVRKALEMGAYIEVKFHNAENEDSAKNITSDLNGFVQEPFKFMERNGSRWYQSYDYKNKVEAVVYF